MKSIKYKCLIMKRSIYDYLKEKEFDIIGDIFIDDRVYSMTYKNAYQINRQLQKNYYTKRTILDKLVDTLVEVWYDGFDLPWLKTVWKEEYKNEK